MGRILPAFALACNRTPEASHDGRKRQGHADHQQAVQAALEKANQTSNSTHLDV